MNREHAPHDQDAPKGVKTRLFAVGLIFLGALNAMLSWRGGFAVSDLSVLLLAVGLGLYFLSSMGRGKKIKSER